MTMVRNLVRELNISDAHLTINHGIDFFFSTSGVIDLR